MAFINTGHINPGDGINDDYLGVWCNDGFIFMVGIDGIYAFTFDGVDFTQVAHLDHGIALDKVWGYGSFIYSSSVLQADIHAYSFDGAIFVLLDTATHPGPQSGGKGVWANATHQFLCGLGMGLFAQTFDGISFTNAGSIDYGGFASDIWEDAPFFFLANQADGLRGCTYNGVVFTPAGHIDDAGSMYAVGGDGAYIYTSLWTSIRAYSHDGFNFTNVGSRDIDGGGNGRAIWCDGGIIYQAENDGGLSAYTFDDTTFILVSNIHAGGGLGGLAFDVHGDGNTLYVANFTDGLRAYELEAAGQIIMFT